ncbi:hypothetical protein [Flindersiella endophytica]
MSGHRTRHPKNLDAGSFQAAITSFARSICWTGTPTAAAWIADAVWM